MSSLLDYLLEPQGSEASKAMCFLQGGRYNGDRGSVHAPAPDLLAVVPCDGTCIEPGEVLACGQQTHWHDVEKADELGDLPRSKHAAFYVLVDFRPAPSGMVATLYWYAGFVRPSESEVTRARNDFERMMRQRAARMGVSAKQGRD